MVQAAPQKEKAAMTFIKAALSYLERGFSVIPIRPRDKRPLIPWEEFQNRRPTEAEIRAWWEKEPHANVGIVTGAVSGVVVVDLDSKEAVQKLRGLVADSGLSTVPRSRTGRGWQLFFRHPGSPLQNAVGVAPGLDIRGDGGYVVAPPSIHPNGHTYSWDVPLCDPLPKLPVELLALIGSGRHDHGGRFDTAGALAGVPEGERDKKLFRLACKLRNADVPKDMAERLILEAAGNCQPPFPEREALKKVRSAYERYQPRQEKSRSGEPRLFTAAEFLTGEDAEPAWHLEGLLPASGLSAWIGKPKSGKSTTVRALAVATAQGRPFLGRTIRQGPAILIALEERKRDIARHLRTLGLRPEDPLFIATDLGAEAMATLQAWVKEHRPALVVVDTLQRAAKIGDLDSYAQVTAALDGFLRLAREFGAHLALVHHAPKSGDQRETIDSPLGSTAIAGTVDVVLHLKRARDGSRYLATVSRTGDDLPDTLLKLDPAGWPALGATRAEAETEAMAGEILAFLEKHPGSTKQEIRDAILGDNAQKDRALDLLVDRGRVERYGGGKRGDPFRFSCFLAEPIVPARKQETQNEPQVSEIKGEILAGWEVVE